jgi:hypothetical protein
MAPAYAGTCSMSGMELRSGKGARLEEGARTDELVRGKPRDGAVGTEFASVGMPSATSAAPLSNGGVERDASRDAKLGRL